MHILCVHTSTLCLRRDRARVAGLIRSIKFRLVSPDSSFVALLPHMAHSAPAGQLNAGLQARHMPKYSPYVHCHVHLGTGTVASRTPWYYAAGARRLNFGSKDGTYKVWTPLSRNRTGNGIS